MSRSQHLKILVCDWGLPRISYTAQRECIFHAKRYFAGNQDFCDLSNGFGHVYCFASVEDFANSGCPIPGGYLQSSPSQR